ncbi:ATP-binding cassette domain-containing protein [Clostridia bacterium]|nr:ATP-binding cassette domain-containing protein [Clostridia bacterium]
MANNIIEVKDLSYCYVENGPMCVNNMNISIEEGSFVGIIGQNGAGKSTLMKNLTGLLRPTKGSIYIKGEDIAETPVAVIANTLGYVLQNPDRQLFADTVREELAFGPTNQGVSEEEVNKRIDYILESIGIMHLADEYPPALSKGDRAKVVIGSVLAMEPQIIILDEPTGGQDYIGRYQIMDIARKFHERGHTVVVVTHSMALVAEYCDRIIVLCNAEILLQGTSKEVFSQPEVLAKTFIRPPQITELANRMKEELNIHETLLSVEEMGNKVLEHIPEGK